MATLDDDIADAWAEVTAALAGSELERSMTLVRNSENAATGVVTTTTRAVTAYRLSLTTAQAAVAPKAVAVLMTSDMDLKEGDTLQDGTDYFEVIRRSAQGSVFVELMVSGHG